MSSVVESFFIPDSSLQGSKFPVHLIWNRDTTIALNLEVPSEFVILREIYNVGKECIEIDGSNVKITGFETNGYIGLVFATRIVKETSVLVPLRITIEMKEGAKQTIERNILLFRQHVVKRSVPEEIDVKSEIGKPIIENRICLKNEGSGTAIVKLDISKESDAVVKMPEEMEGFATKFCSTLKVKADILKKDFPKYSKNVDDFITLIVDSVEGSFTVSKEYVKKVGDTIDNMSDAFEESEDFMGGVLEALLGAYLSSINLLTEMHGLLEYLKSLAKNKVLLQNATSVIELNPGLNRIFGCLRIHDLAHNVHEPIEIETKINVKSSSKIAVPLYSIFEWLE